MDKKSKIAYVFLGILIFTGIFILLLLRDESFRPYLIAIIAATGALFGAMPRLLSDTPVARWIAVLVASFCVGVGTWYTAVKLQQEKQYLQIETHTQSESILTIKQEIMKLPSENINSIIKGIARDLREKYRHKDFPSVEALSRILLEIDPENGHGLYYAGEYCRLRRDRIQMRGHFYRYFATAQKRPESKTGDAEDCYDRPRGYCGERTGYIYHIMANDFYKDGLTKSDKYGKIDDFVRADNLVKTSIKYPPGEFTQIKPTNELREDIKKELKALGRDI